MGKGDKKTRRGKIFQGSYGVRRPKKSAGYKPQITSPAIVQTYPPETEPAESVQEVSPVVKEQPIKAIAPRKAPVKKDVKPTDQPEVEKPARRKKGAS